LRDAIEDAFQTIDEHRIAHLVIDLRQNGGGDEALGQRLIAHLVDQPVRLYGRGVVNARRFDWSVYTDDPSFALGAADAEPAPDGTLQLTAAYYTSLTPQPPLAPRFGGDVTALIDGGSFSTTSDTAAALRELGRAVFIGEETGGGYSGNTSGITPILTLPHTKVRVRVPLVRFYNVTRGEQPLDHGVLPDERVLPDPQHPERDPVLERALDLIRGSRGG
jgi:C-terminal processing protease CtpA/Prc